MTLQTLVVPEPELEFGGSFRHIDPRFGISNYGPADLGSQDAPTAIRIGLIGPAADLDGLRLWLERCRDPIPAKDGRYPQLFPEFPGCDVDRGLCTTLVFSARNTREINPRLLRSMSDAEHRARGLQEAVDVYAEEIRSLADENRVDVLVVARPEQLDDTRLSAGAKSGADLGDLPQFANFHDLLKARLASIRQPIQIIRRSTWDEQANPPRSQSRQDIASRAWNLHVALYYKAGGVPWRLVRDPSDFATCYVGVSFYRNSMRGTLDTSVAQVFNERGDGVIVRGGAAKLNKVDRQPHLSQGDATDLLVSALDTYKHEHRHLPARIVLHKSSSFTDDEFIGFKVAAEQRSIDDIELSWITNSEGVRLFRPGAAPPLRGTLLMLDDTELALYTNGSVEFYSTYPGMYIPQPVGIRIVERNRSHADIGSEMLALTKMNWNQTRLDGRLPLTIRTADKVKSILRFCDPSQPVATRYANYM